ncbi:ATP-NAD kinase family protein [Ferrimonas lipolytica]|uniref:ATP-NAD kinase family protein n=1 Tax=Ferrimonas lipolytica TaxID=2724191 RepID=A0A6H1UDU4_9GAMM|nr:ATP-NAD kinase family protein [Ferrimonas lipolytica]QIZ77214.1 ATP-NAD kinase family protein [Ferrimonas lipolytica]
MFKLGLIINPLAGLGGAVALKGSDGVAQQALALGAEPKAELRMVQALQLLQPLADRLTLYCAGGKMGESVARRLGFKVEVVHRPANITDANDSFHTAAALHQLGVDLILFAGGDGTARDIFSAVGSQQAVLGVPAGVKIHSGVYAITPKAAGLVAVQMVQGELVSVTDAEVRDIDENAFRQGQVKARYFGEMMVPEALRFMQAVKQGGRESEQLVLDDIAAEVIEQMEDEFQYIVGSGSTVAAVMAQLGLDNTLLGVDLVQAGELVGTDLTAQQLLQAVANKPTKLVITLIGGQGHLFGRGNQQLCPALIKAVGRENIIVLATKTKLTALGGRALLADTGDTQLNAELAGHYRIVTGYRDAVLYPLANPEES